MPAQRTTISPRHSGAKLPSAAAAAGDSIGGTAGPLENAAPSSHVVSASDAHRFSLYGLPPVVIAMMASVGWMIVSSGLIMLNKSLLSGGFPYPMTLSGMGMAFSGIASYVTCHHLRLVTATRTVTAHFWATKILPIGLFMALTLGFGNLVYLYLGVAFIQILKSFTPVITMMALFLARLETPTRRLIASVLFIAAGTALASVGELNFSFIGIAIMLSSETFEALRLVATQMLLTGFKFHPIEGLMYLAPACTMWLALGSLTFELRSIVSSGALAVIAARPHYFIAAAVMGFAVNSLAYIVIQTASSLTLKVLATVKNVLVVCLGVFLLGEKITLLQGFGYAISLMAFYWYQRIKMEQIAGDTPVAGSDTKDSLLPLTRHSNGVRYEAVPSSKDDA